MLYSAFVVIDPRETLEFVMATTLKTDEGVVLNQRERDWLKYALQLALASKKRAINAATTSDDMKVVVQNEMSDLTALYMRFR